MELCALCRANPSSHCPPPSTITTQTATDAMMAVLHLLTPLPHLHPKHGRPGNFNNADVAEFCCPTSCCSWPGGVKHSGVCANQSTLPLLLLLLQAPHHHQDSH
jgi:hypothetical protein